MKKIFIFTACAMLYAASAMSQTADKNNVYIINGEKVTNFDGSQLIGKTVTGYRITNAEKDGKHTTVHTIDTSNATSAGTLGVQGRVLNIRGTEGDATGDTGKGGTLNLDKALVFVNGNKYDGKLSDISSGDIKSMNIYKPGSEVAKQYGEKGNNGVIKLTTKKAADNTVWYMDGKRVDEAEVMKLKPSEIKSIEVLKSGSTEAIKVGGEEGKTHNYMMVKLK